jgi:hypothetical protein
MNARATLTLARPAPQIHPVRRLPHESDWHFEQRSASIRHLGTNWVRHPAYVFRPIHSVNPEVWKPAHMLWWERVHAAAAADRARNPAHKRSLAMRTALGGS